MFLQIFQIIYCSLFFCLDIFNIQCYHITLKLLSFLKLEAFLLSKYFHYVETRKTVIIPLKILVKNLSSLYSVGENLLSESETPRTSRDGKDPMTFKSSCFMAKNRRSNLRVNRKLFN